MKTEDFTLNKSNSWFQKSPQKQHFDTFIKDRSRLLETLNQVFSCCSFKTPIPETYLIDNKSDVTPDEKGPKRWLVTKIVVDEIKINQTSNTRNITRWNNKGCSDVLEKKTGYIDLKICLLINVNIQNGKGELIKDLKSKELELTYRGLPLLCESGIFMWGDGDEVQRVPVGLIRYAPGPILDMTENEVTNADRKITHVKNPRLLLRGEFEDSLNIKTMRIPENNGKETAWKLFIGRKEWEWSVVLNSFDDEFKPLVLTEPGQNNKSLQDTQKPANSKSLYLNGCMKGLLPPLYLGELGIRRLEYKLNQLLGKDIYNSYTRDMTKEVGHYLSQRQLAMSIAGLIKNYENIVKGETGKDFLDDKLHFGNRRCLLMHHLITKAIYYGLRNDFKVTDIHPNFKFTSEKLAEDLCNEISKRLKLSVAKTKTALHKEIIKSSQIHDDTNSLAMTSQSRKMTFCGMGGINASHASSDIRIRDIHPSHYGRICIIETNEGKTIGLNLFLASIARIRFNGEIETPYKMPEGIIKYWSAFEEMEYELREEKKFNVKFKKADDDTELFAHSNSVEIIESDQEEQKSFPEDVLYFQPYGVAACLVPYLKHSDGTRVMMGAKNMKQALIPERAEPPVIRTGFENIVGGGNHSTIEHQDICCLGLNAMVAYIPWKGFNFEDGIVCSSSLAKRFTTIHIEEVICEIFFGESIVLNKDGFPSLKHCKSSINTGDAIFNVRTSSGHIKKIPSDFSGELLSVERFSPMHSTIGQNRKLPHEIYKAIIRQERPLRIGDKIMGRHGNKGVISLILPDEQMPKLPDGSPVDLILNPNGVISRMNLSQIFETHWGWVAYNRKKSGDNYNFIFQLFQEPSEDELKEELKKLPDTDESGKVKISFELDGATICALAVVGIQYIMKLNHIAAKKLKGRKTGEYNLLTGGAVKGKNGGQKIGEMEYWALHSYQADVIIGETYRRKGLVDKIGDRFLPRTSTSLDSLLKGMCIINKLDSDEKVSYLLADSKTITSWGNSIVSAELRNTKKIEEKTCIQCHTPITYGICNSCGAKINVSINKKGLVKKICQCESKHTDRWTCPKCNCSSAHKQTRVVQNPIKGGLLDPELFGEEESSKYLTQFGNIPLNVPVVNPLFETRILKAKLKKELLKEGIISHSNKINIYHIANVLYKTEDFIDGSYPTLSKIISRLQGLSKEPGEDVIIESLPVIPLCFRDPDTYGGMDLHRAYYNILKINQKILLTKDPDEKRDFATYLQIAIYKLFWGNGTYDKPGLAGRIQGRKGIIRTAMLARRVDYSARAVIVPDPSLRLDECILPKKMEAMFDSCENDGTSSEKIILINRAATLHKYNILSFKVKSFWNEDVIGFPPLVCSYMNADFDGDTVAIHVPLSREAIEEAKKILSPVRYLLSYANGSLLPHISQDIVLGIYLLSKSPEGKGKIASIFGISPDKINAPISNSQLKELCMKFLLKTETTNQQAAEMLFQLSKLGFDHATASGASFSIFDVPMLSMEERLKLDNKSSIWRDRVYDKIAEITQGLAEGGGCNGVAWIIVSGARGSKDQIVQLGGIRGTMVRPDGHEIRIPIKRNFREGLKLYECWISASGTRKGMVDKHINTRPAGILHRMLVESGYNLDITEEDCGKKEGITIRKDWDIPSFTENSELQTAFGQGYKVSFLKRILGRTLNEPLTLFSDGTQQDIPSDRFIDYNTALLINKSVGLQEIKVRSPLTCSSEYGICSKCYGLSLDTFESQSIGTPVGLIAGHIMGERCVQLALRTFHTGGASVATIISSMPWIKGLWAAKKVFIPAFRVLYNGDNLLKNKWEIMRLLFEGAKTSITSYNKEDYEMLSINDLFLSLRNSTASQLEALDKFIQIMTYENLSIYNGEVANIHFETLLKALFVKDRFKGIFSKASDQKTVLASAGHDRAVERIFKASIERHQDDGLPWREKFMRGII